MGIGILWEQANETEGRKCTHCLGSFKCSIFGFFDLWSIIMSLTSDDVDKTSINAYIFKYI